MGSESRLHWFPGQEREYRYDPESMFDEVWALGYYLSDDFILEMNSYKEPVQTTYLPNRDRYIIKIIRHNETQF
jgi:hypothetical protein